MKKLMTVAAVAAVAGAALAAGLGPQSYVQNGLVAHFDAIDNEGTGTHNPSAAVWRDLKGSASLTPTGGAGWTGRYFDSSADLQKFADMPAFQRNSITVETAINIVSNGNRSASGTVYPRIFNAPRCTLHSTGNTSTQFRFYMSDAIPGDNNNSRPTTPSFRSATVSCYSGSEYFAVALDAVQKAKTSKPATAYLSIGGGEWSLNGPDGYLHGHYYALRMYNRMLSMGEMATNAVIDKLRFWSYSYTGGGETVDWGDIAWTLPEGATDPAPSTLTNNYVQLVNVTANVAATDKMGLLGLSLEDGATLDIASDAAAGVKVLYVEGVAIPRGIYTGTGPVGTQVSWLSGDGILRVAGSLDDGIPDIIPTPAADGWYEFGITTANGGRTWRPGNWYIVADWPKWDRLLFPAGAKVRFVGYTILDTIPDGVFSEVDFTHAEYILLHGHQVFADGSPFTIPSGVTLRYQPGNWVLQSNPDEYKLTSEGSGAVTTPLNIVGTLYVHGDGTHLAKQEFTGLLTGAGTFKFGSFGNQARFMGGFAFNGSMTGYQNSQVLWVDSLAVTSSIKGVTFNDCGSTYQTNASHNVNGIFFGKHNSDATADHELYIASVYGNARDITDKKNKRWRCGGALGIWGGNTIHVGKVTHAVHVVGRPQDLGCNNGWFSSATGKGMGNLVVDESSATGSFFLSTNVNVTVGKVTASTCFNYSYHANAINGTTLDITNSCLSTATVKATDIGMLPARISGFAGTVTLTDTATKSYTMPIDFTHGTNYLYNTTGCIGSGTLGSAPASGTIDAMFPMTGDAPVKGEYALARFTSGGDLLAGWTVTLNGQSVDSVVYSGMQVSVKKDATGIWLDVHKPPLAFIIR